MIYVALKRYLTMSLISAFATQLSHESHHAIMFKILNGSIFHLDGIAIIPGLFVRIIFIRASGYCESHDLSGC